MNDRTGQALGLGKFSLGGNDEDIKIEIGQVRQYLKEVAKIKKEGNEQEFVDLHFDWALKLLKQGQPERDVKEIEYLVELNANDIFRFLPVALKLTTKEKVIEAEKAAEAQEKAKN